MMRMAATGIWRAAAAAGAQPRLRTAAAGGFGSFIGCMGREGAGRATRPGYGCAGAHRDVRDGSRASVREAGWGRRDLAGPGVRGDVRGCEGM